MSYIVILTAQMQDKLCNQSLQFHDKYLLLHSIVCNNYELLNDIFVIMPFK